MRISSMMRDGDVDCLLMSARAWIVLTADNGTAKAIVLRHRASALRPLEGERAMQQRVPASAPDVAERDLL